MTGYYFFVNSFYAACTYFKISKVTGLLATIPVIKIFAPVISALIIIWMYCVLAKLLENITLLNTVGQNSLYLCGSEYIVKHLASATVGILGLKISVSSGLMVYIYCILLIVLTNRFLVPCEKSFLLWIQKHLARLSVSGKQRDPNKAGGQ